jgi:hypothetical protein
MLASYRATRPSLSHILERHAKYPLPSAQRSLLKWWGIDAPAQKLSAIIFRSTIISLVTEWFTALLCFFILHLAFLCPFLFVPRFGL